MAAKATRPPSRPAATTRPAPEPGTVLGTGEVWVPFPVPDSDGAGSSVSVVVASGEVVLLASAEVVDPGWVAEEPDGAVVPVVAVLVTLAPGMAPVMWKGVEYWNFEASASRAIRRP